MKGSWIIKPASRNVIRVQGGNLWVIGNQEGVQIYDLDFNPISTKVYERVEDSYKKIFSARVKNSSLVDIYNQYGNLLSGEEYTGLTSLGDGYIAVSKYLDDDLKSCVLDTLGVEQLCLPYAEIYPLGKKGLYIAKDLYDFGIVDEKGETLLDFKYKRISYHADLDLISLDKGNYISDLLDTQLNPVVEDFKAYVQPKKHGTFAYSMRGEEETALFDSNGKFVNRFSNELGPIVLIEEYIRQGIVQFGSGDKTVFVNAKTGQVYK